MNGTSTCALKIKFFPSHEPSYQIHYVHKLLMLRASGLTTWNIPLEVVLTSVFFLRSVAVRIPAHII